MQEQRHSISPPHTLAMLDLCGVRAREWPGGIGEGIQVLASRTIAHHDPE
jgi:hypothetical protein